MKLNIYCVHDSKGKAFVSPFYFPEVGQATRHFSDLVNEGKNIVSRHPEDYKLYHMGYFDDQAGVFESLKAPVWICDATDYKQGESNGKV